MASTPDMAPNRAKTSNGTRAARASAAEARIEKAAASAEANLSERELEAQVAQLQSDLKAIRDTLTKLTGEKVNEAKSLAKAQVGNLQVQGERLLSDAQDQAGEAEKQLKDTIREKPLTAVAAAAGIGFVLALLTRH
ncbi:DUF883 family protein [Devosia sediminis]|uniref:DUF883 domain-containing protein n=1 Tax=Devosia sediminis TaxID=2798801 RepID=A0A934IUM9_9HYPH|nr:DUF883 family protein [Devosia sediminis]MBJ3783265.1 DUF883 domain-containing protein [Devosia sediminis]